jgi:hypothetical protein
MLKTQLEELIHELLAEIRNTGVDNDKQEKIPERDKQGRARFAPSEKSTIEY